jgi:hypothetical protein
MVFSAVFYKYLRSYGAWKLRFSRPETVSGVFFLSKPDNTKVQRTVDICSHNPPNRVLEVQRTEIPPD